MGWKARPKSQFRVLRASGGECNFSPAQEDVLRRGVLSRAVDEGLIPRADLSSWQRHAEADLWGTVDLLNEMADARRQASGRNDDMAAAASRPDADGEHLIASAIRDGKFGESRREFWRERFRRDPLATRATIEVLESLPPLRAASSACSADDAASVVGSVSPGAAKRLGMAVIRDHPLGSNLPPRLEMPPPRTRTLRISDRA